jgi:ArsR family transcriptional regulator
MLMDLSDLMKALSDVNRLRILNLLQGDTLCVCDLEDILGLNQANLSRHLAKLRSTGLVSAQKRGLFTYYSRLALPEPYKAVGDILYTSMRKDFLFKKDLAALGKKRKKTGKTC